MNTGQRVLGIIPARGGSKGLAGKNVRPLGGKPLLHYTVERALQSTLLDTCMLSTDCIKTAVSVMGFPGIEVPFLRPEALATDSTPSIEVVRHALTFYEARGIYFDYVCLLQPTTPFRGAGLIDACIRKLFESGADSLVTVRTVAPKYHPCWAFRMAAGERLIPASGKAGPLARRQLLPSFYYRDGKVYLASRATVEAGTLIGPGLIGYVNDAEPGINIDTWDDWLEAEKYLIHER